MENENNIDENDGSFYIKNAIGLAIIHFSHVHQNADIIECHPPLDYHIHFLTFSDAANHYCGAILLDTNDVMTRPLQNDENSSHVVREVVLDLSKLFIDKVSSLLSIDDTNKCSEVLFQKSSSELWDFFNQEKQKTYLRDMKRFASLLESKNLRTQYNKNLKIEESPAERYRDVDIWVTEDRFLASAAS